MLHDILFDSHSIREHIEVLPYGWLYYTIFGAMTAGLAVIPYTLLLLIWGWVSARSDMLERNWLRVGVFTALHALPLAFIVAYSFARHPDKIRWEEFSLVLSITFCATWAALYLPRLLVTSLYPGALMGKVQDA